MGCNMETFSGRLVFGGALAVIIMAISGAFKPFAGWTPWQALLGLLGFGALMVLVFFVLFMATDPDRRRRS
jgi:hypothetical protein